MWIITDLTCPCILWTENIRRAERAADRLERLGHRFMVSFFQVDGELGSG